MFEQAVKILSPGPLDDADVQSFLAPVGFTDCRTARRRLSEVCDSEESRTALGKCLPMLLTALSNTAMPDMSLVNFDRYARSIDDRRALFEFLGENPRAVEILVRLFVSSQFLTEVLLRNPSYLDRLTQHKRVSEFKTASEFRGEALAAAKAETGGLSERLDAVRRVQHWELLRIGACDTFGLMDFTTITQQLSLLADAILQTCLAMISNDEGIEPLEGHSPTVPPGFAILAMGKLGGEELNYSSDIDLVFVSEHDPSRFWKLGQRLIKSLIDVTTEGFLYRVDMRLRPWGRSGALVCSVDAYLDYLARHAKLWEKQSLLKARVVAGDERVGRQFLERAQRHIFSASPETVRQSVRVMKSRIEQSLHVRGKDWGQVKSGAGSIRDVEFVVQSLQLIHGRVQPQVCTQNTLSGLVRLADAGLMRSEDYRRLSTGYLLLRTIEHALQLMHNKQVHALPEDRRELAYLARRLDFPDTTRFVTHYTEHRVAIRAIYDRLLSEADDDSDREGAAAGPDDPRQLMEQSYGEVFSDEEIAGHAMLLERLGDGKRIDIAVAAGEAGRWRITIVAHDRPGLLSMICGLLSLHRCNITSGHVFTAESASEPPGTAGQASCVDVFTVILPDDADPDSIWQAYRQDLVELVDIAHDLGLAEAQGRLVLRVAGALDPAAADPGPLLPVSIEIDNDSNDNATLLRIRSEDTIGFLYELSNALAISGISIRQVVVSTRGQRVFDTLHVTDTAGHKLTDPDRQHELRATVVLIKHFTHLLPSSTNPESALVRFRDLLEQLLKQPNWPDQLSSLEHPDVLQALARLLGVSDFLWEDFLRLQHSNLFPLVADPGALELPRTRVTLQRDLDTQLTNAADFDERRVLLNAFKDREMFRVDMRHILGHVEEFGQFSIELTDLAETIVTAVTTLCRGQLEERYGRLVGEAGGDSDYRLAVLALGKCGGRELGFASDIELLFVYDGTGRTDGDNSIRESEFSVKLVELFNQVIQARRDGIFEIDLRLRPYGSAGSLAVSLETMTKYFAPEGAAWPFERQALVKLRPVAGDPTLGAQLVGLRDEVVYGGVGFDVASMRAMRDRQVRQLIRAGTFNAKLSPGGLVDTEYLVQGLQITHGGGVPAIRTTNTLSAIEALHDAGFLDQDTRRRLREAYVFQRRLIDALRMVRGDARDLAVPERSDEQYGFLARRLGYGSDADSLARDLDRTTRDVETLGRRLQL